MPVGDALLTRSVVITTAGTDYPTGLVAPGGAEVDELDLTGLNLSQPLALVVVVTAISGTNTLLKVSFEVAVTGAAAFSTVREVVPQASITTTGTKLIGWLQPVPERYGRFKVVSTSDTTAAATVYCMATVGGNSRLLVPTA